MGLAHSLLTRLVGSVAVFLGFAVLYFVMIVLLDLSEFAGKLLTCGLLLASGVLGALAQARCRPEGVARETWRTTAEVAFLVLVWEAVVKEMERPVLSRSLPHPQIAVLVAFLAVVLAGAVIAFAVSRSKSE